MDALHEQLAEALRVGRDKVGPWLSAALDDPGVCAEMKADIRAWMEATLPTLAAYDAARANGGWTLAADELPPIDVPVWCEHEGNIWIGGRCVVEDDEWVWCYAYNTFYVHKDGSWDAHFDSDDDYKVTRWHHLQPPPEQT